MYLLLFRIEPWARVPLLVSMRAISATVTQFLHLQSFINYGPKDDRERFMVIFVAEEIVYKAILGGK